MANQKINKITLSYEDGSTTEVNVETKSIKMDFTSQVSTEESTEVGSKQLLISDSVDKSDSSLLLE